MKVVRVRVPESLRAGNVPDYWQAKAQLTVIGGIYTIRAINVWPTYTLLRFDELDNSEFVRGTLMLEPGFNSVGFRPVVERKTSIEIFQKMLTPKQQEIVGADRG